MPAQHAAPATQHEAANAVTEKAEAPTAATALRQIDFIDLLHLMNVGDRKGQPSRVSPAASMGEGALRSDVTNGPFHVLQTPTRAEHRTARQPLLEQWNKRHSPGQTETVHSRVLGPRSRQSTGLQRHSGPSMQAAPLQQGGTKRPERCAWGSLAEGRGSNRWRASCDA